MKIESITTIMQDALSTFLQNDKKFWQEEDAVLISVFEETLKEQHFQNGADIFSVILGLMTETAKSFKDIGEVSIQLWKTVLQKKERILFNKLKEDYEIAISPYRRQYKAPMSEVLIMAYDYLKKIQALLPLCNDIDEADTEAKEYMKSMAKEFVKKIMHLTDEVLAVGDGTYMTAKETTETYAQIISDSFDNLIALEPDKEEEVERGVA